MLIGNRFSPRKDWLRYSLGIKIIEVVITLLIKKEKVNRNLKKEIFKWLLI